MMKIRLLLLTRLISGQPVACRVHLACRMLPVLLALVLAAGCSSPTSYESNYGSETAATFDGPRYLRGTIGSYGNFVNDRPRYVGGYGMVVDLNASGSNEVPGFLREWLANEMRRQNLGSIRFGTEQFSAERVMADLGSSVVAVEGLIPPGAARGSKFDLLVTMIDQTSTSLAGGRLFWPTQMSSTGLDRRMVYTQPQATGYGDVFVNPVTPGGAGGAEFLRQAVVVNGGTVLESQKVQFVLNQPNYGVANRIADRINARFAAGDDDRLKTAIAKNDALIEINVPQRFASQPDEMLALIEQIHLNPSPQFVRPQAEDLGKALVESPSDRSRSVSLAWKMLGPNAVPMMRSYYNHPDAAVQTASLEAGAWLQDNQTVEPLKRIAVEGEPAQRVRAANSLVAMTRVSGARQAVLAMLNDPDPEVRIGAYEALVLVNDRAIERLSVDDGKAHKFFIDRVPSKYPMVYAVQGDDLAIVVFGGDIPLRKNIFATVGDDITLSTLSVDSIAVGLYDRQSGDSAYIPIHRCGALQMIPSLTPVSSDPAAKIPPPDWQVEVGDKNGNSMLVNIRDTRLQDAFGVNLLNVPGRDTPSEQPRAVAMVRIVKEPGKDKDGKPTPAVGELIQLRDREMPLPVALRYRKPGDRETKVYRVTPTVATLAYTLGYKIDNINTQIGPDLTFSQVVSVLYTLAAQDQIPAAFDARLSPVAQAIEAAQQLNQSEPRPEITPEELERLRQQDEQPGATPAPED